MQGTARMRCGLPGLQYVWFQGVHCGQSPGGASDLAEGISESRQGKTALKQGTFFRAPGGGGFCWREKIHRTRVAVSEANSPARPQAGFGRGHIQCASLAIAD